MQHAQQLAVFVELKDAPRTGAAVFARNQVVNVDKAHGRFAHLGVFDVVLDPHARGVAARRKLAVKEDVVHVVAHHVRGGREPFAERIGGRNQDEGGHGHHARQTQRRKPRHAHDREFGIGRKPAHRVDGAEQRGDRHDLVQTRGQLEHRQKERHRDAVAVADVAGLAHEIEKGDQSNEGDQNEGRGDQNFLGHVAGQNFHDLSLPKSL